MRFNRLVTAILAASLLTAPTVATAQSATATRIAVVSDSSYANQGGRRVLPWIPLTGFVLYAFVLYLLYEDDRDGDRPASP